MTTVQENKKETVGEKTKSETKNENPKPLEKVRLGVWELIIERRPLFTIPGIPSKQQILQTVSFLPYIWQFLTEIYTLAPWHLILVVACRAWESIEGGFATYFNGRILDAVSPSLFTRSTVLKSQ